MSIPSSLTHAYIDILLSFFCFGSYHLNFFVLSFSSFFLFLQLRQSALERHIFFWLGKETSQDEQGVAAYKTVELDQSLGGEPVQHREVQEGESDEFLGLFKQGVSYMAGGIATGFKTVDRSHTVRLLHVKVCLYVVSVFSSSFFDPSHQTTCSRYI